MEPDDESIDQIKKNVKQQMDFRKMYETEGIVSVLSSQSYQDIIKKTDTKFTDEFFPPNNGSIYNYDKFEHLVTGKSDPNKVIKTPKIRINLQENLSLQVRDKK